MTTYIFDHEIRNVPTVADSGSPVLAVDLAPSTIDQFDAEGLEVYLRGERQRWLDRNRPGALDAQRLHLAAVSAREAGDVERFRTTILDAASAAVGRTCAALVVATRGRSLPPVTPWRIDQEGQFANCRISRSDATALNRAVTGASAVFLDRLIAEGAFFEHTSITGVLLAPRITEQQFREGLRARSCFNRAA